MGDICFSLIIYETQKPGKTSSVKRNKSEDSEKFFCANRALLRQSQKVWIFVVFFWLKINREGRCCVKFSPNIKKIKLPPKSLHGYVRLII